MEGVDTGRELVTAGGLPPSAGEPVLQGRCLQYRVHPRHYQPHPAGAHAVA